jgi:hypothetical protein
MQIRDDKYETWKVAEQVSIQSQGNTAEQGHWMNRKDLRFDTDAGAPYGFNEEM